MLLTRFAVFGAGDDGRRPRGTHFYDGEENVIEVITWAIFGLIGLLNVDLIERAFCPSSCAADEARPRSTQNLQLLRGATAREYSEDPPPRRRSPPPSDPQLARRRRLLHIATKTSIPFRFGSFHCEFWSQAPVVVSLFSKCRRRASKRFFTPIGWRRWSVKKRSHWTPEEPRTAAATSTLAL